MSDDTQEPPVSPPSETWHAEGRRVGPIALGSPFTPTEHHQKLRRYVEEDFDTFELNHTNHSKVGVRDGRVYWVLCGLSFSLNGVEHIGLSRQALNTLHTKQEADWTEHGRLMLWTDQLSIEIIAVEGRARWVNVTLRTQAPS